MKAKFSDLSDIKSMPIPLSKKPEKNGDHAVITYKTLRNDELNISVTESEFEQIEFSQDWHYMQLPSFLTWKKSSKGPYLARVQAPTEEANTDIKW